VLNHPAFHFAADARTIVSLTREGLKLVELFNAGLDQQHPDGRAAAERRAETLWDDVLSQGALIYGLATDDAHHFDDASERARIGKFAYTGDRAWIMVRAEAQPAKIRQALLEGQFYATTGVRILRLKQSSQELALELAPESANARIRFVGRGGRTLAESRGPQARYVVTGEEGYVRAVAEMDSGEKAWVQPVMVSQP
jgi:hypothetical protein